MNIMEVSFTRGMAPSEVWDAVLDGRTNLCWKERLDSQQTLDCLDNVLHLDHIGPEDVDWTKSLFIRGVGVAHNNAPIMAVTLIAVSPRTGRTVTAMREVRTCRFCPLYGTCESCGFNLWDETWRDELYVDETED